MDKLKMHSMNKVDENIEKIGKLFPNCITERKNEKGEVEYAIDFDMLKQELSAVVVEGNEERYQFTWPDKKKSILLANAPIAKTLRPCREESVDFDNTENLYIEGDNLDVLKLLQETYLGKIKMIYIDPPYNTGNDFVYNDDFSKSTEEYLANSGQYDEEDNRLVANTESNGRFHTDWLNMMYPRLKISKDLLTDDGVIFISIDDNELENLKKLCNEIFGEENFVTTLHVEMSATQGMKVKAAQNGNIVKNAEYILIYSKDGHKDIAKTVLYDFRPEYDEHYSKFISQDFKLLNLKDVFSEKHPNIKITNLSAMYIQNQTFREFVSQHLEQICADDKISGYDINEYPEGRVYKVSSEGKVYYIYNNGTKIRQLLLLKNSFGPCDDFQQNIGLRKIRGDWWKDFYRDMGNVSKEGDMVYANGKKPVRLLYQLCKMCLQEGEIVLDFFSGSATTAHAVMQLNARDERKCRYIMVQLPDVIDYTNKDNIKNYQADGLITICDIGKERIRRAGSKILEEAQSETIEAAMYLDGYEVDEVVNKNNSLDIGFRVLKLDSTNMKDVYYNPEEFEATLFDSLEDNIKEDRTPEDLLFQVMLDLGVLLSSKIEETEIAGKKVFNVADNFLIACFDENVTDETITAIAKQKPYYFVMRDSSMASDSVATNFDQIFATYSPDTVRKVL